jgi:hypothetical protein
MGILTDWGIFVVALAIMIYLIDSLILLVLWISDN